MIVKPKYLQTAEEVFPDINITEVGHKYLGSFIGTTAGTKEFIERKVEEWIKDVEKLSDIANREPQVAYAAFIYGKKHGC